VHAKLRCDPPQLRRQRLQRQRFRCWRTRRADLTHMQRANSDFRHWRIRRSPGRVFDVGSGSPPGPGNRMRPVVAHANMVTAHLQRSYSDSRDWRNGQSPERVFELGSNCPAGTGDADAASRSARENRDDLGLRRLSFPASSPSVLEDLILLAPSSSMPEAEYAHSIVAKGAPKRQARTLACG
jgi:hypothetical protein